MRHAFICIFVLAAVVSAGCGSSSNGGQQPSPSYNRVGSSYMPTASDKALTYTVVRTTNWGGPLGGAPGSEWEDTDPTTYRVGTVDIDGSSYQVMSPTEERPQRFSGPVFSGTQLLGTYSNHGRIDWLSRAESTGLTLLPAQVPDIGGKWQTGSVLLYGGTSYVRSNLVVQGEVLGTEAVTTPAGSFSALKIAYTGTVHVDSTTNFSSGQTFLELPAASATIWYADGVGPVRAVGSTSLTGEVEIVLSMISD